MSAPFDIIAFAAEAGIELPELPEAALQPPEIAITASQRHDSEAAKGAASPVLEELPKQPFVPDPLRSSKMWLVYKAVPGENGRINKIPYSPKGYKENNPARGVSFEEACAALKDFSGLGCYVEPPLIVVDLDKCRNRETGEIEAWAWVIIKRCNSFTEASMSGTGVHIWMLGEKPGEHCRRGIEIYNTKRFMAWSGVHIEGTPVTVNKTDITDIYNEMLAGDFQDAKNGKPESKPKNSKKHDSATEFHQAEGAPVTTKMQVCLSGTVTSQMPFVIEDEHGSSVKAESQSEADASLILALLFKHEGNARAVEEEFRSSALYREKHHGKDSSAYIARTIKAMMKIYEASPKDAKPATMPESSLLLVRGSEIKPEHQEWLWKNRFPANTLTNIVGEPDKGKGVVSADLVARLTTGRDFPDGQKNPFGKPVEVLMFIAEDSLKSTVIPRLMQAGANVSKVIFLDSVLLQDGEKKIKRQLALDTDLPMIKKALAQNPQIRVGVVDTITSYMGNANQYRDSEMRKILLPFRDLAEEMRVTFVTIAHFNKTVQASAMNRTGGSIALTAVPRAVWCCTVDPDEEGQYLFLQIKGNLGKKLKGLSYRIEDAVVDIGESQPAEVPKLVWGVDGVDKTADDVLVKSADPKERGITKAEKFLQDVLADGLPHLSKEVFDAGLEDGISSDNIKKARRNIGIQTKNIAMQWYSRLPTDANNKGRAPWVIVPKTVDVQGDKLTA